MYIYICVPLGQRGNSRDLIPEEKKEKRQGGGERPRSLTAKIRSHVVTAPSGSRRCAQSTSHLSHFQEATHCSIYISSSLICSACKTPTTATTGSVGSAVAPLLQDLAKGCRAHKHALIRKRVMMKKREKTINKNADSKNICAYVSIDESIHKHIYIYIHTYICVFTNQHKHV